MAHMVQTRRAAIVGGAVIAVLGAALFTVRRVPDRVVGLFRGPTGLERTGGLRVRYRPPAGVDARALSGLGGRVRRDGGVLVLELPGVAEDLVDDVADVLVGGGLEMCEALETNWAGSLAHDLPAGVTLETDLWRDDHGGYHRVPFLAARTRGELERAVAGAPFAADIGYERYEERDDDRVGEHWRTYLLAREVLVDGSMIAYALHSYDPNTNRPVVLLDFTPEGAERFCHATARLVGHKVATVLGGRVRSAPIINGSICGGRASITPGGRNMEEMERQADMLRAVLMQGAVPSGGTIEASRWYPRAAIAAQEWAGRGLLGLVAGLAFAMLAWLVLRVARPVWAAVVHAGGPFPTRRLLVTLAVPVVLLLGRQITLPGVNEVELDQLAGGSPTNMGVLMLGVTPLLSAFALVELVALAIPGIRHDPQRRLRLGQAVALVGLGCALAQGYFDAAYLETLTRWGAVVSQPGLQFRLVVMVSLATGTVLLAILAGTVTSHGLGNGYGAVLLATWLIDAAPHLTVARAVAFALIAAATACVLRWRIAGADREAELRVPTCGVAPLNDAGGLAIVLVTLSRYGLDNVLVEPWRRLGELHANRWLPFALIVAFVLVWSWLFARPALVERVAMQAGVPRPSRAMWLRATLVSLLLIATAGAVGVVAPWTDALLAMVAGAVLLDIVDDARARRAKLAVAGVLHQIQRAGVIERVLGDADIPCHIHAGGVRTLFAFFGPWAPAIVLVPDEHAARARTLVADAIRPATAALPPAKLH